MNRPNIALIMADYWDFRSLMRPVPSDGVMPPALDYDSGRATRGTAVQFADDE